MSDHLAARGVQSTVTTTESVPASGTLTLRALLPERRVQWETEVIDNEHLGKRSSKKCCIFHKPRKFDDSSSDESSGDDAKGADSSFVGHNDATGPMVPLKPRMVAGIEIQPAKPKQRHASKDKAAPDTDNCDHCAYISSMLEKPEGAARTDTAGE